MDEQQRARLISMYGEGPAVLRSAWDQLPTTAQTWKPSEHDWSAHQIVVHAADSETYAATRIRLLIAEREPLIVGYDQEMWARVFDYESVPVESSFAVIDAIRAHTTSLIASFSDDDWARTGRHTESGAYSAIDWLESYGNHLHDHASQILGNLAAWRAHTI